MIEPGAVIEPGVAGASEDDSGFLGAVGTEVRDVVAELDIVCVSRGTARAEGSITATSEASADGGSTRASSCGG